VLFRSGSIIALAVILAAFLAADMGLFFGLRNAAKRYRGVLADAATATSSMALSQEEVSRWLELKSALGHAAEGEKAYAPSFTRWKTLLAALGSAVPPEMRFVSARFSPSEPGKGGAEGGRGEVRGIVRAGSPSDVQRKVSSFLSAVRGQPVVGDADYSVLALRPRDEEAGGGYEQEFLLNFTMREQ